MTQRQKEKVFYVLCLVIFVPLFLYSFISSFPKNPSEVVDNDKTLIKCNFGNKNTFTARRAGIHFIQTDFSGDYLPNSLRNELSKVCEISVSDQEVLNDLLTIAHGGKAKGPDVITPVYIHKGIFQGIFEEYGQRLNRYWSEIIAYPLGIISAIQGKTAPEPTKQTEPLTDKNKSTIKNIDTFIKVGQQSVFISPGIIDINTFEGSPPRMTLTKEDNPKLFDTYGDGFYLFTVEEIQDRIDNKTFLSIALNVQQRGGFSPVHIVVVDSYKSKIIYESPDAIRSIALGNVNFIEGGSVIELAIDPYYFTSPITTDKLRVLEYSVYDKTSGKYVLANNRYIPKFQKLLTDYEAIDKAGCWVKGEANPLPISQIQKTYGDGAKCLDMMVSGTPTTSDYFITVGQFNKIKAKIQQVVNGENVSILD